MMIVVTGATGNTGRVVVAQLLAAGDKVRAVGRSAEKLERFRQKGAEVFVGEVTDAEAMARAFAGAGAAYLMIPPDMKAKNVAAHQDAVSNALGSAVEKAGVKHVALLSSIGADHAEKVGPIKGLHRFEQRLNRIANLNALYLRPGFFMENLFQYIGLIKSMGMLAGTERGDVPGPWIATRDIGVVAAEALRKRDFSGKQTRELLGARDYTMQETARIVGKAIGKEKLSYSKVPAMMVRPAMAAMGLSPDLIDNILEMYEGVDAGLVAAREPRSPQNTTPTTLEQFVAEVFVPAYRK
jgi:uncharacterized protein YbjT (DUF2867 family)